MKHNIKPVTNHCCGVWLQPLPNYFIVFIRSWIKGKNNLQVIILPKKPPVELTCLSQSRSQRETTSSAHFCLGVRQATHRGERPTDAKLTQPSGHQSEEERVISICPSWRFPSSPSAGPINSPIKTELESLPLPLCHSMFAANSFSSNRSTCWTEPFQPDHIPLHCKALTVQLWKLQSPRMAAGPLLPLISHPGLSQVLTWHRGRQQGHAEHLNKLMCTVDLKRRKEEAGMSRSEP